MKVRARHPTRRGIFTGALKNHPRGRGMRCQLRLFGEILVRALNGVKNRGGVQRCHLVTTGA